VIHEMKDAYARVGLVRLCRLLGITRQAYYQHFWHLESAGIEQELVLREVQSIRTNHRAMGGRKFYEKLQPFLLEQQIKMGRDALFDLLAENRLLVKKRRRWFITTFSNHWLRKWPNQVRGMEIVRVNQLWVSDITYWKIGDTYNYISLVTDAYSRKIIGYHLSKTLQSIGAIKALQMAIQQLPVQLDRPLWHHSDRGVQYCCEGYIKLLQDKAIGISMTENGDPLENAIAVRINGILKSEYLGQYSPDSFDDAVLLLRSAVELYNNERPHLSIGMLTPQLVHSTGIHVERLWKNYYVKNAKIVNPFQDNEKAVNALQD
jgi:putative transposase